MFPFDLEDLENEEIKEQEIMYKEYGIDFKTGKLTGEMVEGLEAVKVWAYFALQIPRYRFLAYSIHYGSEIDELIGTSYGEQYIISESGRMVEDALLVNRYITGIEDFTCSIVKDQLQISFIMNTVYGSSQMEV